MCILKFLKKVFSVKCQDDIKSRSCINCQHYIKSSSIRSGRCDLSYRFVRNDFVCVDHKDK